VCKFEERKEKGKEQRQRHLKIAELKDRMLKNQEDWSISSKKPEYQQPVLVTSETQTCADDLRSEPFQDQKTTKALQNKGLKD